MLRTRVAALAVALFGVLQAAFAAPLDEASIVRGGRLYDDWARELRDRAPPEIHPALGAKGLAVASAASWRCAECHGWDYQGHHGFVGIRSRFGADPAAIAGILTDATHRYGGLLAPEALLDLARFVSRGQVDSQAVLAAGRNSVTDKLGPARSFGTLCAGCHGLDGTRLREIPPLGDGARQRTNEVLHVVLNGHPGGSMPALSALGNTFAGAMVAYMQALPSLNLSASIAHGGRLYDDWQRELGTANQLLPHPTYPRGAYYATDAALTWRCKSCHGWDYLGRQGQYANGRHVTGFKGIRGLAGADPARVLAVLDDSVHRYGAVMKAGDLLDLANFVSFGQVDMDAAIDRGTLRARGDTERAGSYFRTICSACHGVDGRRIPTAPPLGLVARSNPWEALHKIVNGHPDERMPSLRDLDRQRLIDILAHLQTLPDTR